uniref:Uncharacterized mitochondrial protein AtMg00810-like n=1 Tax=Tanacetum cinerariifolium TaxID=118510 RepID=A0A6L2JQ05_TANCI|nr:uncharacterized mitochondrial protein AtMg00810-like [Tanacetum cinerariifolium]
MLCYLTGMEPYYIQCIKDDPFQPRPPKDFQENSNDEVDERTSAEYLRDSDTEFHERALLAGSKRSIKEKTNFLVKKQMKTLSVLNVDEEEVSNDEEMIQVKVLMDLIDDELVVGKNHARNGEWIDITMRKVERHNTSRKLPNFNTRRILVFESLAVNEFLKLTDATTDPESSKESGSEPQTPLPLLKFLQGAFSRSKVMTLTYQEHYPRERPGLAFRVFNTRRQQVDETYHVTFDESMKAISIIGEPTEGIITRSMVAKLTAILASECLFVNFLFEIEPKKVSEDDKGISICQEKYTSDLLKKYEISDSSLVKTPMVPPNNLGPDLSGKLDFILKDSQIQRQVGMLECKEIASAATVAIVSAVCQANDHGFGEIRVPKQKRNTGVPRKWRLKSTVCSAKELELGLQREMRLKMKFIL